MASVLSVLGPLNTADAPAVRHISFYWVLRKHIILYFQIVTYKQKSLRLRHGLLVLFVLDTVHDLP